MNFSNSPADSCMSSFNVQLIAFPIICLKTSPTPMGLIPGLLFNGISLQLVSALIDFGLTIVDASVLAQTAICSVSSSASVSNFLLSSI